MNEKDFELLCILDETKNITKAANRLYITQSALSKRIINIEKELNTEILIRSHGGIHFTAAGEQVLSHAKRAAKEMESMRIALEQMDGEVCGTLKAGFSINYSLYTLPDLLASYHQKYPKVKLQLSTGQSRHLYKQLLDGTVDIAVLRGEFIWDGVQILLSQESLCVICNKEYKDVPLSEYMYIGQDTDNAQTAMINRWLFEHNINIHKSSIRMDSITSCVEMVKRGLGWGIVPSICLKNFHGIALPCSFANGEPLLRKTYILCRPEVAELPQIRSFITEARKMRM